MPTLNELIEAEKSKSTATRKIIEKAAEPAPREEVIESRKERKVRVPIGGARDILTVDGKEPGFEYRWVQAYPDRINRFKRAGWEVVTHNVEVGQARAGIPGQLGSAVEAEAGGGARLVLMRIESEYYKEDQDAKEAEIRTLEDSMGKDVEGGYGSIKIQRG